MRAPHPAHQSSSNKAPPLPTPTSPCPPLTFEPQPPSPHECRYHASGEPMPIDVAERAEIWGGGVNARWRPWLSLGGVAVMVAGSLVMFYPMCGVLADFGLPEAVSTSDCLTSVVLMAVVGSLGWAALLTSLCWTCTRPWAALLLCTVSLGAHVSTSVASPFVVLLWATTSGFLLYWCPSRPDLPLSAPFQACRVFLTVRPGVISDVGSTLRYLTYIPEAHEGYHPIDWRTAQWGGRGYRGGAPPRPPPGQQGYQGYSGPYGARPGSGKDETTAYV